MRKITGSELRDILREHKRWLNGEDGAKRADLRDADLRYAHLYGVNLRNADLRNADLRNADLYSTDLRNANLEDVDLRDADLRNVSLHSADLSGANLSGAILDYSELPLWCGSLTANFDDKQLKQIAYHLVSAGLKSENASAETKRELRKLVDFANGFHRVEECGMIEWDVK